MQLDISTYLQDRVSSVAKQQGISLREAYNNLITIGLDTSEKLQRGEERRANMHNNIQRVERGTIRSIKL